MGIIRKIIITDSRGYIFVSKNTTIEGGDNATLIEKSLQLIACKDNPDLYEVERRRAILYVRFIR